MPVVNFVTEGRRVEVAEGTTLLEAGRRAGVLVEAPCAGEGTCGKCTVRVSAASRAGVIPTGRHRLQEQGFVLACDTRVAGSVEVETLPREEGLRVLAWGADVEAAVDPFVTREYVSAEDVTRVFGGDRLLRSVPGDQRRPSSGVAVDIGTTTLAAALVDLGSGRQLAVRSELNPQAAYGQDVLSRIKLAGDPAGLELLHDTVSRAIARLVRGVAADSGIALSAIDEVVYCGNPCMLHLAVGVDPSPLGRFRYASRLRGDQHVAARDRRIGVPDAPIYLPPILSGYVGADITAGLVATGLPTLPGTSLFIDIGTNGEMVVARDGRLAATSSAAGPAFEGMNVSSGMRAAEGAIEAVTLAPDGALSCDVIGGGAATGICGSGLVDLVAALVERGVLLPTGRFRDAAAIGAAPLRERLETRDGKRVFRVTGAVSLTQGDVRQLQLAKAAIRTGVDFLLRAAGVDEAAVDRVLVAGGFGYHLRPAALVTVGLLPAAFAGKIQLVGNSSLSGGRAFLVSRGTREAMRELAPRVELVDLPACADFERHFVGRIGFPG